jgi:hypothetical protein
VPAVARLAGVRAWSQPRRASLTRRSGRCCGARHLTFAHAIIDDHSRLAYGSLPARRDEARRDRLRRASARLLLVGLDLSRKRLDFFSMRKASRSSAERR